MDGLIGKKAGMTEVYDSDGTMVPVTVIEIGPCVVLQRKTAGKDGYEAVQLGFDDMRGNRSCKARTGHCSAAGASPKRIIREFSVNGDESFKAGDTVTLSVLDGVAFVDVAGISKGKGFQGVVKRYGMRGGPMTHGGHSKRRIGSIGANSFPARVSKGKKMPGHMGCTNVKARNLKVIQCRAEDNMLLVKGSVPGPAGEVVIVSKALKNAGKA